MVESKIILALDVSDVDEAKRIVNETKDYVYGFKIGLKLYLKSQNKFVEYVSEKSNVFLDLKFHDIPSQVSDAVYNVTRLNIEMMTIHVHGGGEMMLRAKEAAVESAHKYNVKSPLILGVTVLTSLDVADLLAINYKVTSTFDQVIFLSNFARKSGIDGVISSPLEAAGIRKQCGKDFKIVTPGITAGTMQNLDQKRTLTPKLAIENGSDFLVIGRSILNSEDRVALIKQINEGKI